MIKGPGTWLLTKSRPVRFSSGASGPTPGETETPTEWADRERLAWSRRGASLWVRATDDEAGTPRKIQDLDRAVTLERLQPTAVHTTRFVIRSWERERRPEPLRRDDEEQTAYTQLSDAIIIDRDDQLEALVRYAREVKKLLTMQDTKRRQYVTLSEDIDFDVDLNLLDAWDAAAPHLRALREADLAYEKARRRLVRPVSEALQIGIPGPALAAEAGRTRQWIQQTASNLRGRNLLNTKSALDRLAAKRPQWAAGLVMPAILPLTEMTEDRLGDFVDRILQTLNETMQFKRGEQRISLPQIQSPETTITVDDDAQVKILFRARCEYPDRVTEKTDAADWTTRSSESLADVADYCAIHGGTLTFDVLDDYWGPSRWPFRRIILCLDASGLSQPRRRGRLPRHSRGI